MTRKRIFAYGCKVCGRWTSVRTATAQRFAQRRGTCMTCCEDPEWRTHVYIRLIELHIEDIKARGGSLPENQRELYRSLLRKRRHQLKAAKSRLEGVAV